MLVFSTAAYPPFCRYTNYNTNNRKSKEENEKFPRYFLCCFMYFRSSRERPLPRAFLHSISTKIQRAFWHAVFLAGDERFERPNDGVRDRGLTAWRIPIMSRFRFILRRYFNKLFSFWQAFLYAFGKFFLFSAKIARKRLFSTNTILYYSMKKRRKLCY